MSKEVISNHVEEFSGEPSVPPADLSKVEIITLEDDPHRAALEDDYKQKLPGKTWAAVFFLGFTFQPALAFSILGVFPIISVIAMDVQGTTTNSAWMSSGWTLGGTIAFAIAGRISDIFGRRYVLLIGQLILIVSYVRSHSPPPWIEWFKQLILLDHWCDCTANSLNQLIAAMAVGGFGTGTALVLYPGLSEILPNRYRSVGLAWTEFNLVPMSIFGSLAGHALAQNATWRWIFIIGGITAVISLVGTAVFYFPPPHPHAVAHISRGQLLKELDYVGFFLYTVGLTILLVGLYQGGNTRIWHSAGVVAPIVLGGIAFIGCFIWEFSGVAKRPLFPFYMFKKGREFTSLIVLVDQLPKSGLIAHLIVGVSSSLAFVTMP